MEIRIATPEDAREILEIYAPYIENTAISFEYEVPSLEEFRGRIENTLKRYPYLVAVENGRIIGYSYASNLKIRRAYDHTAEVSIYVDQNHKGRGIGRALYAELEKYLVRQNIFQVYACITGTDRPDDEYVNDSSEKFHSKMGFRLTGRHDNCGYKFGKWFNMFWMEKILAERPEHPDDFIPFSRLAEE